MAYATFPLVVLPHFIISVICYLSLGRQHNVLVQYVQTTLQRNTKLQRAFGYSQRKRRVKFQKPATCSKQTSRGKGESECQDES